MLRVGFGILEGGGGGRKREKEEGGKEKKKREREEGRRKKRGERGREERLRVTSKGSYYRHKPVKCDGTPLREVQPPLGGTTPPRGGVSPPPGETRVSKVWNRVIGENQGVWLQPCQSYNLNEPSGQACAEGSC